jgi:flagellar hook-associated protein 3 FlgL
MRVTQQNVLNKWLSDVQNRLGAIDELNRQIGSGLRVQKPADDPAAASRIVRMQEVVARNDQYLKNTSQAVAVNQATDAALAQINDQLVRVKSLAVEGSNDASVAVTGGYQALADEIAGLRSGILQTVSSKLEGKYLFSGTTDEVAPFGANGGSYQGDSIERRVNMGNGQSVAINLPGDRAFRETEARSGEPLALDASGALTLSADLSFRVSDGAVTSTVTLPAGSYTPQELVAAMNTVFEGAGANLQARMTPEGELSIAFADTQQGGEMSIEAVSGDLSGTLGLTAGTKNIFGALDDLSAAMKEGNPSKVASLLGRLDRALDGLGAQRGVVGSQGRNLDFARSRIESYNVTTEALKSDTEGVDAVKAITKLSAEQQAYQTALAAGARILNVSILDYLR